MKIGLLGGTFNPVHLGHLLLAEGAKRCLSLDLLLWVPAHLPPHKNMETRVSPEVRARMVELAIQGHSAYRLSRVELDRPPPSYTIDTVKQLQAQFPERGNEWFLLVGSENARELPHWREFAELRKRVKFVAVPRPGDPVEGNLPSGVKRLAITTAHISSSNIRQRLRQGLEIRHLVPEAVGRFIAEKGLYR